MKRVIDYAKDKKIIKTGDYVVVTFGNVMGMAGRHNTIKVECIDWVFFCSLAIIILYIIKSITLIINWAK